MLKKLSKSFKTMAKASFAMLLITAWMAPVPVAASTYNVTGLSDWYFYLEQETAVTLYGNSNEACSEIDWQTTGTDPYLFLYDYDNNDSYLTEDDDANHNDANQCVSSKITGTYPAGIYRIRAGYWDEDSGSTVNGTTGNPNYEQDWGDLTYTLATNGITLYDYTPSVGPPMNLTVTDNGTSITLDWDVPNTGYIPVERYAISWTIPPAAGWGISTGNVGDANFGYRDNYSVFNLLKTVAGLTKPIELMSVPTMTLTATIQDGLIKLRFSLGSRILTGTAL